MASSVLARWSRFRLLVPLCSRGLRSKSGFQSAPIQYVVHFGPMSVNYSVTIVPRASVTDDGKTIVCWHPEQPFPYEHSKPLPVLEPKFKEEDSIIKVQVRQETDSILNERDLTEEDSIIKVQVRQETESILNKRDLTEEDLMRLTYNSRSTFKHFQNKRRRMASVRKPNPEMDRIGV